MLKAYTQTSNEIAPALTIASGPKLRERARSGRLVLAVLVQTASTSASGTAGGPDVERFVGHGLGELGQLLDEVTTGHRPDAAPHDLQACRAQRGRRDGRYPAIAPISSQVSGSPRTARLVRISTMAAAVGSPQT